MNEWRRRGKTPLKVGRSTRLTMFVPPDVTIFEHQVIINPFENRQPDEKVESLGFISNCRTEYPAVRCECAMFNIAWDERKKV